MTISTELSKRILEQAQILDQAGHALQQAQDELPTPDAEEVALLWEGGSLSIDAYLIGLLQRVVMSVENAASDLRTGLDEETLANLDQMRPSAMEINAIEAALGERLQKSG